MEKTIRKKDEADWKGASFLFISNNVNIYKEYP
jgi:hypothetical protein